MVDENYLMQGLMQRGLPQHIAQGFVMNMRDESGLNPGINEVAPLVPGSRGGFGLYQVTGPRRRAYEAFAQERGADLADPDAQLDFLMTELQGPERRAAESIFSAQNPQEAAVAIARDFLRPAPENLQKRVARYTGGNMQPQGLLGTPIVSTQGQAQQPEQEQLPFFQRPNVANFFDTLAIGLEGMTLNPNRALIQGAQQRIQGRREAAQTAQQRNRTADWLESQGMTAAAEGVRSGAISARDALAMARGQQQDPYSTIGKLQADLAAGRISQEQYEIALQSMAPSNTSIEVGPDGQLRFVQGPGAQAKPFTEGQSKDLVYATRAEGALQVLDPVADQLVSAAGRAANVDPTGFIRSRIQSPEFQVAQQAGNEFLQAILRKDTGAAITEQEQALYGQTYLPQPGDSPEVLIEKKAARRRALDAIRRGMSPSQLIALERDVSQEQQGGAPQVGDVVDGYQFQGGDPADQNNWRKVQ